MEPTKKVSPRDAVVFVQSNFPPGTKLRYKPNGDLYMIGGKQYIVVGAGGNTQVDFHRGNNIIAFTLN